MAFTTKRSLLSKIKEGDAVHWEEFYRTYAPLIWIRGGDRNLTPSERQDLMQDVMVSLFSGIGRFTYDPAKGRFRDYIRRIIDRRAVDIIRKRDIAQSAGDDIEHAVDNHGRDDDDKKWIDYWREHVFTQALVELKGEIEPKTYQAFELYAIDGWSPAETAKFTGMSVNSVYVAKNRAMEKLKDIISKLKEQ